MNVFVEVKRVLEDYLGPAAERYIRRQAEFHLEKPAEEMTIEDVAKLIEWTKSSLGLLTQDKAMVDEVANRLAQLCNDQ